MPKNKPKKFTKKTLKKTQLSVAIAWAKNWVKEMKPFKNENIQLKFACNALDLLIKTSEEKLKELK